jgi:hypothetical protein
MTGHLIVGFGNFFGVAGSNFFRKCTFCGVFGFGAKDS